jgi:small subunit ribosomal protein S4
LKMGDPKKFRKKYKTPMHPWNAENIRVEKELSQEYGLKNKKEIWVINSVLKKYKGLAKKLIAVKTEQGEKEKKQMMEKLQQLGLIEEGAELDNVLSLEVKDIMERRLQSLVFRKGLSRSMNQARQFITHRHVMVGDKKITFPSKIISREEEDKITFDGHSSLNDEEHPERVQLEKETAPVKEAPKEGKEEIVKKVKEAPAEKAKEEKTEEKPAEEAPVKETEKSGEKQ